MVKVGSDCINRNYLHESILCLLTFQIHDRGDYECVCVHRDGHHLSKQLIGRLQVGDDVLGVDSVHGEDQCDAQQLG